MPRTRRISISTGISHLPQVIRLQRLQGESDDGMGAGQGALRVQSQLLQRRSRPLDGRVGLLSLLLRRNKKTKNRSVDHWGVVCTLTTCQDPGPARVEEASQALPACRIAWPVWKIQTLWRYPVWIEKRKAKGKQNSRAPRSRPGLHTFQNLAIGESPSTPYMVTYLSHLTSPCQTPADGEFVVRVDRLAP